MTALLKWRGSFIGQSLARRTDRDASSTHRPSVHVPAIIGKELTVTQSNPLYQEIILEYYESPRNRGRVENADACCRANNPSCGDDLTVSLNLAEGSIAPVMWDGRACAISEASASMMTEAVATLSADDARTWVRTVRAMVTGNGDVDTALDLGDIDSLRVVNNRPARIKCALLAWEALDEALTLAEAVHARTQSE